LNKTGRSEVHGRELHDNFKLMETYIERLARHYTQGNIQQLGDYCFVLPSRRAALFLNQALALNAPDPIWIPRITTISEFMAELDKTPVADSITLLFKLHLCYQSITGSPIMIDEFVPVGEMLLSDFNDIDNHLADPEKVFANLADLKALSSDLSYLQPEQVKAIKTFWESFDPQKISRQQRDFLQVWDNLSALYSLFYSQLKAEGIASEGMVARNVASKAMSGSLMIPYKKIVFAGFNAINGCEKALFNYLKTEQKADFFWDYPSIAHLAEQKLANLQHEATRFIKANMAEFPEPPGWLPPTGDPLPTISFTSAPNDLAQALAAHDYLKSIHDSVEAPERVALVLADELQLLPTLHSIPDLYTKVNITLGFPVKGTPASSFVENLLTVQKSARVNRDGSVRYFTKHLVDLLRHQYMESILNGDNLTIAKNIAASNNLFTEQEVLSGSQVHDHIFRKIDSATELGNYLSDLLVMVYRHLENKQDTEVEREFIFFLYTSIKRLSDTLSELQQTPSIATWHSLFKKIVAQKSVPFKGEPLNGLQVMGILETRLLDFDHIVITGLNEGVFPRTTPPRSFIPNNLRKGYGLPTLENQDAIYAYYFYRLLSRAKTLKLIHTTTRAITEEAEMSRFMQQLYFEYPAEIKSETLVQQVKIPKQPEILANKNELVLNSLLKCTIAGGNILTPSALSTYIECPLRFYYRYVAQIKEPDEIMDDMDPRSVGNIFHKVVETLYKPYVGQVITNTDIEKLATNHTKLRDVISLVLNSTTAGNSPKKKMPGELSGKNSLAFEILFKYVQKFLTHEISSAPFYLISLEKKVDCQFRVNNLLEVNIGGVIDRVDEKDGIIRVLDYKTGSTANNLANVEKLFLQEKHGEVKAIFQTLLYALILNKSGISKPIMPGLVPVKKLFRQEYDNNFYLSQPRSDEKTAISLNLVLEPFTEGLKGLLEELFNPSIPFQQTEKKSLCEYCPYKENCLV